MNLKLVVASMSVLGLVSCPVFAATSSKHKHHHKHHHHQEVAVQDYKDYKDMIPVPVCSISQDAKIVNSMNKNIGRSMPDPCNPGWFNRIQMSGGVNIDLGKFGKRNTNYMGVNYQRFSLNDAYLNVAANINDWARAFASISYNTATINAPVTAVGFTQAAEYSAAYDNNAVSGGNHTVQLEQGYGTIGNFDVSPIFLNIGKKYMNYGEYMIHPITRSMTQVLTETLATAVDLGFVANGFNGSIFAFDDPLGKNNNTRRFPSNGRSGATTTNYGIGLGYQFPCDQLGFNIGAGYLYNMIGVNDVAYTVNQFNQEHGFASGYHSRVSATEVHADLNAGPFVIGARYTTALQRFNINDAPKNGNAPSSKGAKPWAGSAQAGYGFEYWGKAQNIYVGYQLSRETAALLLPKDRWLVGYAIEWFGKGTSLGIEWDHDNSFSHSNGGEFGNGNLVSLRTAFKFN